MTYSQQQREYWAKRPANVIKYMTVTFYHPDFDYIRLVANQYATKTFDGDDYQPVSMQLPEVTNQSSDQTDLGNIVFGKGGVQVKEKIEMITPLGGIKHPITVTLRQYEGTGKIFEKTVLVAANGLTIGSDNVSVRLSVDNIARLTNKRAFYEPAMWKGLQSL